MFLWHTEKGNTLTEISKEDKKQNSEILEWEHVGTDKNVKMSESFTEASTAAGRKLESTLNTYPRSLPVLRF
jgi:hypothetical protein